MVRLISAATSRQVKFYSTIGGFIAQPTRCIHRYKFSRLPHTGLGSSLRTERHVQINSIFKAFTSSESKQQEKGVQVAEPEESKLVEEEEIVVSKFSRHDLVPEVPLKSLDLVKRIDQVEKKGSFSVDIFLGKYDHDFLNYPEPLDNRIENQQLKEQATMVKQLYPQVWDDPIELQKFNFFNIFQMSVSEMMTVFEAIGASSRQCYTNMPNASSEAQEHLPPRQTLVTQSIISLIIRNCLTYWPIYKSKCEEAKKLIPQKHLLYGGSANDNKLYMPIGFCWTEQVNELGSLPPQEWLTIGKSGGDDIKHTRVQGKKTSILHDDSVENYLIYFKDEFLSKQYLTDNDETVEGPNPASDPFVGCCLVNKSEVNHSAVYFDSAGCQYVDIEFDVLVPDDHLIFPAQRRDPTALNIKALGQLATCSVIMGILKDSLAMTYKHLLDNKRGLITCDIIERKLTSVTGKIFAIESMVYYIAGIYDGLKEGYDAHMEATILKIITNEFAYECLKELQHICSSDMFIISKLQDQINIFDCFLDGNIHNRLYVATMGILWYARNKNVHLNQLRLAPWYPGYLWKSIIRERSERGDFLSLDADIYGNLHPSLKDAAVNLEFIIKRVKYATETICMKHGSDATGAQSALYKLAQLSIDVFMLTAMCARASKAYCNGSRNAEMDVALTVAFSDQLAKDVRLYMEAIRLSPINAFETRAKIINELNIKNGGYYAESPLDPNV